MNGTAYAQDRHPEPFVCFDPGEIDRRNGWREPGDAVSDPNPPDSDRLAVEVLRWALAAPRALPKTIKLRTLFAEFVLSRFGSGSMADLARNAGVSKKTISELADDFVKRFPGVHVFGQRRRRKRTSDASTKPAPLARKRKGTLK